jgi:hydrogenase maturation factor
MAMPLRFPVGKLPPRVLEALLARCPVPKSSRVIIGPRFGEDAAVIDLGPKYLVAKTDPITFTAERIGWYAVHINANDIATLGARPRWFLATLLLPESGTTAVLARRIFDDALRACCALGITLCGGHTEITAGLSRPIVVGQMLGEVEKSKLVRKESQQPGDLLLLTKGIALEGTAILARENARLLERRLGKVLVRRAQRLLFHPGISVVREALLAVRYGEVHAMHDPTEGGLLSGLYELARAGRVGLRVWKTKVPVLEETRAFSQVLRFDPFALIASGTLLVVVSPRTAGKVLSAFARHGICAAIVGEVRPEPEGVHVLEQGATRARLLRVPARDEIARLLERSSGNRRAGGGAYDPRRNHRQ